MSYMLCVYICVQGSTNPLLCVAHHLIIALVSPGTYLMKLLTCTEW